MTSPAFRVIVGDTHTQGVTAYEPPEHPGTEAYDAVVLAGGAARRLGGVDKPGLGVGGRSLLERVLAACADARTTVVVADPRPVPRPVVWAREESEVRAAQRLRYLVFAGEMGARLNTPPGAPPGHDIDLFDAYCEHLLVRTAGADHPPEVIGTYRLLTPAVARRIGSLYSETEFDLTRLRPLRPTLVELGRSCVHPAWRSGGAILALWAALAEFMHRNSLTTMVGCASVSMRDGGHVAASLWEQLRSTHPAPIEWQVQPRLPLPIDELRRDLAVEPPPLVPSGHAHALSGSSTPGMQMRTRPSCSSSSRLVT